MEQQVQQLIDLTEKGLIQMAGQMGVTLPQFWEILIKQQYVEAMQAFISLALCLIISFIVYKKRKTLKSSLFDDDTPELCVVGITGAAVFLLYFAYTMVCFFEGMGQIINPEYYAIQDITEFISNLTNSN